MVEVSDPEKRKEHVAEDEGNASSTNTEYVVEGDYGSNGDHVFTDESNAIYWRKVYEQAQYEGRHRYDPSYKWSAAEEKKLLRKVGQPCLGRVGVPPKMLMECRLTGESCSGHGLCFLLSISIGRTSIEPLQTTWWVPLLIRCVPRPQLANGNHAVGRTE